MSGYIHLYCTGRQILVFWSTWMVRYIIISKWAGCNIFQADKEWLISFSLIVCNHFHCNPWKHMSLWKLQRSIMGLHTLLYWQWSSQYLWKKVVQQYVKVITFELQYPTIFNVNIMRNSMRTLKLLTVIRLCRNFFTSSWVMVYSAECKMISDL